MRNENTGQNAKRIRADRYDIWQANHKFKKKMKLQIKHKKISCKLVKKGE